MKTTGTLSLSHERVDDIPLLLGFMQQLNLPVLLERHLGSHHLHRGLSNGWLATVWLTFLLSQSNHRKVSVQDWAGNHSRTLETLIGERLRPVEFGDDRLSIILRRLHDADWSALEADLWAATCEVYEISYQCIRWPRRIIILCPCRERATTRNRSRRGSTRPPSGSSRCRS